MNVLSQNDSVPQLPLDRPKDGLLACVGAYASNINHVCLVKVERLLFIAQELLGIAVSDDALSQVAIDFTNQPEPHCLSNTLGTRCRATTSKHQEAARILGGSTL